METAIARIEEQEHYGSWLSTEEEIELAKCEETIEQFRNSGLEAGRALITIFDQRLYRKTHDTFEKYLKDRWDWDRSYGWRLIRAAKMIGMLPTGDKPETERQVRPLGLIKDPEKQREIWAGVVEQSEKTGEKITAKKVEQAVREYLKPTKAEPIIDVEPEAPTPLDEVKQFTSTFRVDELITLGDQWGEYAFYQSRDDALDQLGFGLTGEDEGLTHWRKGELQINWKFIIKGVK
jgi:hypothetical protein